MINNRTKSGCGNYRLEILYHPCPGHASAHLYIGFSRTRYYTNTKVKPGELASASTYIPPWLWFSSLDEVEYSVTGALGHHGRLRPVPGCGLMWLSLPKTVTLAVAAPAVPWFGRAAAMPGSSRSAQEGIIPAGCSRTGASFAEGRTTTAQLRGPTDEGFTAIAVGGVHTCGLKSNGTTVCCWGHFSGLSENLTRFASVDGRYRPPFPPPDQRFTAIEAGGGHTCGILTDGSVVCWDIRSKFSLFGMEQVVEISAGGAGVCGLRSDGRALCRSFFEPVPPEVESFVAISTAPAHSCGLRSGGTVLCWGLDYADQLSPPEDGPYSAVAAGALHTCALRSDGSPICWGFNLEQAVEVTGLPRSGPGIGVNAPGMEFPFNTRRTEPPEDERFTAITAGTFHTCGLREDGGVACWGYDNHGQASPPDDSE